MSMGIFPSFSILYFTFFVEDNTRVLWKVAIIQIARRKRRRKEVIVIGSVTYSIIEFDNLSLFFSKSYIETARILKWKS